MKSIKTKSILQKVKHNPNLWFGHDYNINLYRGCAHNCIYCDSRSQCYQIDNFNVVRKKENAITILNKELASKKTKGVIGLGAMSDTYNPFEKEEQLTRQALELIRFYGFGVGLETKSDLVARDKDILKQISPCIVKLSITTADDHLSSIIEPGAPVTSKRFEAIKQLSNEGIYVGVLLNPILPFITDDIENIKTIIKLAYENGAKFVYSYYGLTLRDIQRDYFYHQLDQHFPTLKNKYIKTYGSNYSCFSKNTALIKKTIETECKKYGLYYKMSDIIYNYKTKYIPTQLSLDI